MISGPYTIISRKIIKAWRCEWRGDMYLTMLVFFCLTLLNMVQSQLVLYGASGVSLSSQLLLSSMIRWASITACLCKLSYNPQFFHRIISSELGFVKRSCNSRDYVYDVGLFNSSADILTPFCHDSSDFVSS